MNNAASLAVTSSFGRDMVGKSHVNQSSLDESTVLAVLYEVRTAHYRASVLNDIRRACPGWSDSRVTGAVDRLLARGRLRRGYLYPRSLWDNEDHRPGKRV